jgi:hypothetical protein
VIIDSSHFEAMSLIQEITKSKTVTHHTKIVVVFMTTSARPEKDSVFHNSYLLPHNNGSNIDQIFSDNEIVINHNIKNQIFALNHVITSSSHQEIVR